jgi:hypothetical protein
MPENWPDRSRGPNIGSYLLGGVMAALLLLRFVIVP